MRRNEPPQTEKRGTNGPRVSRLHIAAVPFHVKRQRLGSTFMRLLNGSSQDVAREGGGPVSEEPCRARAIDLSAASAARSNCCSSHTFVPRSSATTSRAQAM